MAEVLCAPRVITGAETVTDGAVVVGDRTVDWAGPAAALPAEYAALPRARSIAGVVLSIACLRVPGTPLSSPGPILTPARGPP